MYTETHYFWVSQKNTKTTFIWILLIISELLNGGTLNNVDNKKHGTRFGDMINCLCIHSATGATGATGATMVCDRILQP